MKRWSRRAVVGVSLLSSGALLPLPGCSETCEPEVLDVSSCAYEEQMLLDWLESTEDYLSDAAFPLSDPRFVCRLDEPEARSDLRDAFGEWSPQFTFVEGCGARTLFREVPYPPNLGLTWDTASGEVLGCSFVGDVPNERQCGSHAWSVDEAPDCAAAAAYYCVVREPPEGTGATGGGLVGPMGGEGGAAGAQEGGVAGGR